MVMSINKVMRDDGPEIIYSEGFRRMIEDHLLYLRNHESTQLIEIRTEVAYKGHGDFVTVLQEYDVPRHLHWIVMRLNGYTSPMDYDSSHTSMLMPSSTTVNSLLKVYRVNHKI